jgi:hypothetical protein
MTFDVDEDTFAELIGFEVVDELDVFEVERAFDVDEDAFVELEDLVGFVMVELLLFAVDVLEPETVVEDLVEVTTAETLVS